MLQINCPWCGNRDEIEFCSGGESHIIRPTAPEQSTDSEWSNYQFNRINPEGIHFEQWCHTHGCRQWFNMARNTVTHQILAIYKMGENAPDLSGEQEC